MQAHTSKNMLVWLPLWSWATYVVLELCICVWIPSSAYKKRRVLLFCGGATILWQLANPFGGASIKYGASNKDIMVRRWLTLRCVWLRLRSDLFTHIYFQGTCFANVLGNSCPSANHCWTTNYATNHSGYGCNHGTNIIKELQKYTTVMNYCYMPTWPKIKCIVLVSKISDLLTGGIVIDKQFVRIMVFSYIQIITLITL